MTTFLTGGIKPKRRTGYLAPPDGEGEARGGGEGGERTDVPAKLLERPSKLRQGTKGNTYPKPRGRSMPSIF